MLPILIAQLSQTAMGFIDTVMAGHYSSDDLAAVALGSGIWLPVMISLSGILMAVTPITAHHVGSEQIQKTSIVFQQGILIACLASLCAWLILQNSALILELMAVPPELQEKTQSYLKALSWGLPGMMLFQCSRSFCEGFGRTRPIMKIGIFALVCNIPLNYIFIYGKLGVPALGSEGCGWASALVMWIMCLLGLGYLRRSPLFRGLKLIQRPGLSVPVALNLLQIGLPIGFTLLIEVSMFSVIALLIARLGETTVAAHQITLTFTGMVFMLPLSMAMALTIRTGHLLGQKQFETALLTARTGYLITLCTACLSALLISTQAELIASLYTHDPQIIQLASHLLVIAAIFQIPDTLQVTSSGLLRGHKDTQVPMLMVFTAFWVIGLPIGYTLGLTDLLLPAMGAAGFWYGLVTGLTAGAILLVIRYLTVAKRCSTSLTANN